VTLYVPAFEELKELTEGVAELEVNPFGPVQEYDGVTFEGSALLKLMERLAVLPLVTHWLGVIIGTDKKFTTTSSDNVQFGP
jgi:hypothetical protein